MGRAVMRRERRQPDRPRNADVVALGRDRPVENVWTAGHPDAVQTQDGDAETAGRTSSRMTRRVVNCTPEELCSGRAARPSPGRSSMADPALPPTPRILYIEDNPESRALVRSVLEPRGFDVLEASDGIAGIDLAIAAHPDLILCDIQLPGIDGYETATRLRSYKGLDGCPIVVLTSHGDRGLSLSIGCDGYIEKPIDVEKFPQQLRAFLKGKREKVRGPEERRYLREYSQSLVERLEATVRELTAANTRLRAAARSKNEFMQNLSHEMATPLTPIVGYLKILRGGKAGTLSDQQQKILESIATASERLSRTIDNLVDFATLEGGGQAIHREDFEVGGLVSPVFEEERSKAKSRRIHLEVRVETQDKGFGDVRKLRQAVSNLIDNAIKFSPHGSDILVRASSDPTRLLFEVYDQGEGFLPGEADRVFEPFFHADRVGEERAPGAGLGLPVAKQIVEAHGGHIWLESPPKSQPEGPHHFSGAKVAFWIPAKNQAPKQDVAPQPLFAQPGPEGGTS
ncbi:MAG: hybrid sensor histidine kinase/response regulator [Deltaproteobacteria bacterium]|nr:MAG: hybrid sensor histidine kinase/response regulator [Deltaproteobacteria bacterium]